MLVSPKKASIIYNVSQQKLKRLSDAGKIPYLKTDGGHRRYVVESLERAFNNSTAVDSIEIEKLKKENQKLRDRIARLEKKLSDKELAQVNQAQIKEEREKALEEERELIEAEFQEWKRTSKNTNYDEQMNLSDVFDIEIEEYYCEASCYVGHKASYFLSWRESELSDKAIYASDVLQSEDVDHLKSQMAIYIWLDLYPYGWCQGGDEIKRLIRNRYGVTSNYLDTIQAIDNIEEQIEELEEKRDRIKGLGKSFLADRELINKQIKEKQIKVERYTKLANLLLHRHWTNEAKKTIQIFNDTADYAFEKAARDRVDEKLGRELETARWGLKL